MGAKVKATPSSPARNRGAFVISGGSRGLGRTVAIEAAKAGFSVALLARNKRDLESAKKEVSKAASPSAVVSSHALDLSKKTDVDRAVSEILDSHGTIRALINNAATWMPTKSISETSAVDVQMSFNLNFFSAFHATQAVLKKRKAGDLAIINIGATASLQGWPGVLPFCLGKGALRSYSQALARELGPKGVHVAHLVIDGVLDNERTRKLNPDSEEDQFIHLTSVAKSVMFVALQEKSCWTFEWDVRPHREDF